MATAKKKLVAINSVQTVDDVSEKTVSYKAGDVFDIDGDTADQLIAQGFAREHKGAKAEAEGAEGEHMNTEPLPGAGVQAARTSVTANADTTASSRSSKK